MWDMRESAELTRSFYARLGADGLARRTRPEFDDRIVDALIELLPPAARVLDAGCGYGRTAVPLSRTGYDVHGVDLAPNLIQAARSDAVAQHVPLRLTIGSFTGLPYASATFDAVICLWSAFNELLEEHDQTRAVAEMLRVLRPGGFCLIEGRPYTEPSQEEIDAGVRRGFEDRVEWTATDGILNPHYRHDERSFRRLCEAVGIDRFEVFERDWGGRNRLFLRYER
jgi:SAM-dependent methyltransferase